MSARRSTRRRRMAGFTLLETLIAMALMGMVLAALATVTAQWMPNWNRGIGRVQGNEHVALGLERMIADLAAAEFIPANRGTRRPLFVGEARSVTFVRNGLRLDAEGGLEIVRIAEISGGAVPTLVRMRKSFAPDAPGAMGREPLSFADPVVLLRGPYLLSFSYAGRDRIWKETWRDQFELPKAIKLTLRDAATKKTLAVSTATSVHAELSAECITAKSVAECATALRQPSESPEGKSRS
jgi:general secretion pathway protein J